MGPDAVPLEAKLHAANVAASHPSALLVVVDGFGDADATAVEGLWHSIVDGASNHASLLLACQAGSETEPSLVERIRVDSATMTVSLSPFQHIEAYELCRCRLGGVAAPRLVDDLLELTAATSAHWCMRLTRASG